MDINIFGFWKLIKRIVRKFLDFLLHPLPGICRVHRWQYFCYQKILRINYHVPWPVHLSSRVMYPERVVCGEGTYPGFSNACYIQAYNGIELGKDVRIAPGVGIISANHSSKDYNKSLKADPIKIGDHCWIGMNVIILPGVCLGDNVIVGGGAVVTKSFPSNVVVAGNPARIIKENQAEEGKD